MSAAPKPDPATPHLEIDIQQTVPAWNEVETGGAGADAIVRRAAEAAFGAGAAGLPAGRYEVSLVLSDDAAVQSLNRDWRGQDKPTNVLSFPALDDVDVGDGAAERLLGDVVIALETTAGEAVRDGKTFADHLAHLTVHGMLHLLGHDHETDDEAALMEGLEINILSGLGVADPYADGAGAPDETTH